MRGGDHDVGFAFDGDGDRVLAVDRDGTVVDGDELVALAAVHLREHGRLPGDGVAVTVMTNYGFHTAMAEAGVEVATTAVGDRYVLDELRQRGWALGGEQSGHIIDLGFGPSGDGIASALLTLEALGGRDLSDRGAMAKLPQRLVNIRAPDRDALRRTMDETPSERRSSASRGTRRPRPRARPRLGDRAADPGDGRGADAGGDRRGLRAPGAGRGPGPRGLGRPIGASPVLGRACGPRGTL